MSVHFLSKLLVDAFSLALLLFAFFANGLAPGPGAAGAKYGTGYCDAQCPHDLKFVDGEANIMGWEGTTAESGRLSLREMRLGGATTRPSTASRPSSTSTRAAARCCTSAGGGTARTTSQRATGST